MNFFHPLCTVAFLPPSPRLCAEAEAAAAGAGRATGPPLWADSSHRATPNGPRATRRHGSAPSPGPLVWRGDGAPAAGNTANEGGGGRGGEGGRLRPRGERWERGRGGRVWSPRTYILNRKLAFACTRGRDDMVGTLFDL